MKVFLSIIDSSSFLTLAQGKPEEITAGASNILPALQLPGADAFSMPLGEFCILKFTFFAVGIAHASNKIAILFIVNSKSSVLRLLDKHRKAPK